MSEYVIACDDALYAINLPYLKEDVVRCGNCLSWLNGNCYKHAYTVTDDDGYEYDEGAFPMDAGDFCSLGTRREEA